ncbi:Glycosyltransferase involved in cell wall bisynthesis [Chishuiella changwenlii]|uniref:Glycosyl transferase n=1 Tax=Chishuiella changwenlii TaxID=1434701 RepID=A0A1M6TWF8_9FLAO|nr:glycosyltransferase [Chishuiella changwenlii]GGF04579.1 glycosyl transferase [Chishuiella changwenlii]SHK61352.1 Glycosyltransferase involved in cell wall bisynthesis [Chishuiella changwenlii]
MRKKKILFRNRSLEVGGSEKILLNILQNLDRNKFDITLVLNFKEGEFINQLPPDVKVKSITNGIDFLNKNSFLSKLNRAIKRLQYFLFQTYPIAFYKKHQLMDIETEIAFSHYMIPTVLNSPIKASKKIFWFHGDLLEFSLTDDEKYKLVQSLLKFDQGVFVSEHSKKNIENNYKIKLSNSTVIYNPINTMEIKDKSNEEMNETISFFDFISIGRFGKAKGFDDLVNAHYQLINEGYKINTAIVGSGEEYENIKQLIKQYNLEDSFHLLGFQSNPLKYLKNSNYFIFPTYTESYPTVVAESLILGVPVLSTNVGGIPEMVINEQEGFLFNPGKENVYKYMKKVLDDKELLIQLKQNCKQSHLKFNLEQQLNKIEQLFINI